MVGRLSPRQKEVIHQIKRIDPSHVGLDALLKTVFPLIQKEVPFQSGWFFPVDPISSKTTLLTHQAWFGAGPPIKTNQIRLENTVLPPVDELMKNGVPCIRGEDWWTPSKLTSHPFYRTILMPAKLYFSLIFLLMDNKKKCRGYLVLWKEKRNGPFSNSDIALMTAFSPVLGNLLKDLSIDMVDESEASGKGQSAPKLLDPIFHASNMSEEDLHALVRRRAQPGILILGKEGEILYLNYDAKNLLERLTAIPKSSTPAAITSPHRRSPVRGGKKKDPNPGRPLPQIIYQLYDRFKKAVATDGNIAEGSMPTSSRICIHKGVV
ncbi:MAG: hypothetical protein ACE5HN_06715, partial [Nitrospiria bacterium]